MGLLIICDYSWFDDPWFKMIVMSESSRLNYEVMLPTFADYIEVFVSDERFLVFALASVVLSVALFFFLSGTGRFTRLFLLSAAALLLFAFVVVAPLSAMAATQETPVIDPVKLNYNFGFLALGLGLFLKFRHLPARSQKAPTR